VPLPLSGAAALRRPVVAGHSGEQAYHPVGLPHVQRAVTSRVDTYMGKVASEMHRLWRDGVIARYVSPDGAECRYSPKSRTFCGTCGTLSFPGVHPNPDCERHTLPGDKPTGSSLCVDYRLTECDPSTRTAAASIAELSRS
jgi:hypothetical protein